MTCDRYQWYPRVSETNESAGTVELTAEVAVWEDSKRFRRTNNGYFMHLHGPAWERGGSNKKLCFVATDQALLADVLLQLAERPDCCYVKYSVYQRDGMYLGRCFLMDDHEVGVVWADFKAHPRLFCTIQDDDFTAPFRPSG
jgi:hypothetical protein